MKTIKFQFEFAGQIIDTEFRIAENINQLPDPLKIETILDVLSCLTGKEQLQDFQIAVLKDRYKKILEVLKIINDK